MPVTTLPEELLSRTFRTMDYSDVLRSAAVCSAWRCAARSDPQLWRDALYIDDGVHPRATSELRRAPPNASVIRHRLETIAACSNGRVDRLALCLHLYPGRAHIDDEADVLRILELLPMLGVRQLWLECVGQLREDDEEWPSGMRNTRHANVAKAAEHALSQCRHLTELHVHGLKFYSTFAGKPIAACQLTKLSMEACANERFLFLDGSLLGMLSEATHVTLAPTESRECDKAMPSQVLWRILETASATLEHVDCVVKLLLGESGEEGLAPTIVLPRLRALRLQEYGYNQGAHVERLQRRLLCPALHRLELCVQLPWVMLNDCIVGADASLHSLYLQEQISNHFLTDGIAELLHKRYRSSLRRLTLVGAHRELLEELAYFYPAMRFDELTAIGFVSFDVVEQLVRARQASSEYEPIRTLRVLTTHDWWTWTESNVQCMQGTIGAGACDIRELCEVLRTNVATQHPNAYDELKHGSNVAAYLSFKQATKHAYMPLCPLPLMPRRPRFLSDGVEDV